MTEKCIKAPKSAMKRKLGSTLKANRLSMRPSHHGHTEKASKQNGRCNLGIFSNSWSGIENL